MSELVHPVSLTRTRMAPRHQSDAISYVRDFIAEFVENSAPAELAGQYKNRFDAAKSRYGAAM